MEAEDLRGAGLDRLLAQPSLDAAGEVHETTANLVGFRVYEEIYTVMLVAELVVKSLLELAKRSLLVARDGDGSGLPPGCVNLDLMLEGVVVKVICRCNWMLADDASATECSELWELTYEDSILGPTR